MDTRGHQLSPTYNEKRFFLSLVLSGLNGPISSEYFPRSLAGQASQWCSPGNNGDVNYV